MAVIVQIEFEKIRVLSRLLSILNYSQKAVDLNL